MTRKALTKQRLNQLIRADILGGDYILDVLMYLHRLRRYDLTDECHGFFAFMGNRLKSIRARMREAVIAQQNGTPSNPTKACKAIAEEVIQDLRCRLKDPRYCNRKKLKADHIKYCKVFRDALKQFVDVLDGRMVKIDDTWKNV